MSRGPWTVRLLDMEAGVYESGEDALPPEGKDHRF